MRYLVWLIRAALFFALFAFALNNQQSAAVHWFFGHQWQAPMVFIVLAAFAFGCVFTLVAIAPRWWRYRRALRRELLASSAAQTGADAPPSADVANSNSGVPHGI